MIFSSEALHHPWGLLRSKSRDDRSCRSQRLAARLWRDLHKDLGPLRKKPRFSTKDSPRDEIREDTKEPKGRLDKGVTRTIDQNPECSLHPEITGMEKYSKPSKTSLKRKREQELYIYEGCHKGLRQSVSRRPRLRYTRWSTRWSLSILWTWRKTPMDSHRMHSCFIPKSVPCIHDEH